MKTFSLFETARAGRRNALSAVFCGLCLFSLSLVFLGAVNGQDYKKVKVDESLAGQKGAALSSGDATQVKDFLRKYYLARWTDQANSREIHKFRAELVADGASLSGANQTTFMNEAIDGLRAYATSEKRYPACRLNAVLALGELNVSAGDRDTPAVPYPGAVSELIKICSDPKDEAKYPDYVRLGALIGLVRHAELGIQDDATRANVEKTFEDVINVQYAEDKGLRDDVYDWFEEKALQGLAGLKSPAGVAGATGALDLFKSVMDDSKRNFEARCEAARAIGSLDLASVGSYDYVALSKSLLTLARDFCAEESTFIDSELVRDQVKSSASQSTGGSSGMGGMGGGMGAMGGAMGGSSSGSSMGGALQNQKSLETIVARVQYGFDCIQKAIKGESNGLGVMAKLSDDNDMKAKLQKALDEIKSTNEFIAEGPTVANNSMGGGMGAMNMAGNAGSKKKGSKSVEIKVDATSMKNHLYEKKLNFNDLLGVSSY